MWGKVMTFKYYILHTTQKLIMKIKSSEFKIKMVYSIKHHQQKVNLKNKWYSQIITRYSQTEVLQMHKYRGQFIALSADYDT